MVIEARHQRKRKRLSKRWPLRPQIATGLMVLGVAIALGIAIAWFAGHGGTVTVFQQINAAQERPPLWIRVPTDTTSYLLLPTIALLFVVLAITRLSPKPSPWSRAVVVSILLALMGRYLLWRSLATLNLDTPLNGVVSLALFLMELLLLVGNVIMLLLLLRVRDRRTEANPLAQLVARGEYCPTVDILIPTYNEPNFILRRTVIGCQALDYPHKQIYVLDDTRRPEVAQMAADLGCHYIIRPTNRHAKAGNLNHALAKTHGELIVVFDADFVPTTNFLARTLGFFTDPSVALVQTPQTFYNADPVARNLGLEHVLTPEEEVFYRQIQPFRDGAGSVICAGTSFVMRRRALEEAGGFVTESLSEDYFTGIRISARGYRLVYLNEKLSAGLAAENIAAHTIQRIRWAQGTLQAFFISSNPLTIPGLSLIQRLAHLEGLLSWFTSLSRVGFLLMPLAYSFLGVIPLRATAAELLYFFLPYYVVSLTVFSWLNERSRSAILSDIYSFALCFPLAITVVQSMLHPFAKGFRVTPKGLLSDRFSFNWKLATPLLLIFILTAMSLWMNVSQSLVQSSNLRLAAATAEPVRGLGIGWFWSIYNLAMVTIGLIILLDVPRTSLYDWFDLRRTVKLQVGDRTIWGTTTMLSEEGAEIALTQPWPDLAAPVTPNPPVIELTLMEDGIVLQGQIAHGTDPTETPNPSATTVLFTFAPLPIATHRQLVTLLYCRPGQWTNRYTPGELASLWFLLRAMLKPRVLFDRSKKMRAIAVAPH
ncbi:MAG: glycosyltransferase [Kaiparowitsia implicata GSE-PSE-MK54-09C]|jgi:cellulose synthase (UDP-forming)|nr:glycosyltransferase [Kaiparowitsia implicata GSE-PSE-MK54-09C]